MNPLTALTSPPYHRSALSEPSTSPLSQQLYALKLVSTLDQGKRLEEIIESGTISSPDDESLIEGFATYSGPCGLLEKQRNSLSQENFSAIFSAMTGLLRVQGYANHREYNVAYCLKMCFAYTAIFGFLHHLTKNDPLKLPFDLHQEAFQTCKAVLNRGNLHPKFKEDLVEALSYVVNHPQMPPEDQIEAFHLAEKHVDPYHLDECFRHFVTLEHMKDVQQLAARALFSVARDVRLEDPLRESTIFFLPFFMDYSNVLKPVRVESIEVLCELIADKSTNREIKKEAITSLSGWFWTLDPDQFKEYQTYFGILEKQLEDLDPCSPPIRDLCSQIRMKNQNHPIVMRLQSVLDKKLCAEQAVQ